MGDSTSHDDDSADDLTRHGAGVPDRGDEPTERNIFDAVNRDDLDDTHPVADVAAGDVLGERYRLEQQLARRGSTLTWRAFDEKLSRSVLVHVLAGGDPRTGTVLEAARKAAVATDSRFLRVLDAAGGENEEPSMVVCEFAPGQSLELLLSSGPLSALEAAWLVREMADALTVMHQQGLFHERLNPDTVIITATGNVKIVGFLIEAALHPGDEVDALAWSEREQADVQAMGRMLYACLVGRWPIDADGTDEPTWGMQPAPMDSAGWLTPRQVRAGVSPALDVICDQILSTTPRYHEVPLRTASEVLLALSKVLGTADASADLERRLRYPGQQLPGASAASGDQRHRQTATPRSQPRQDSGVPSAPAFGQRAGDDTQRWYPQDSARTGAASAAAVQPPPASSSATPTEQGDSRGSSEPTPLNPVARPARNRRWLMILLALLTLTLIASLIALGINSRNPGSGASPGAGGEPSAGSNVYTISGADDFDPSKDGGSDDENPNQLGLAYDGKTDTAWQTLTYLNDSKLGRLKPGVGIVFDLGQPVDVGSVELTLQGSPTGVEIRIPTDGSTSSAPMDSQASWTTVASNPAAGTSVTLPMKTDVNTRYLLVYFTSLPNIGGKDYRAGLAEISVMAP